MEEMNENEQKKIAIEKYSNIQRIKKYGKGVINICQR